MWPLRVVFAFSVFFFFASFCILGTGGGGRGSGGIYYLFFFQLHLKEQKGPGVTLTNYYRGGKIKI